MMKVTFVSNSRVLGYRPGQIVEIEESALTPALRVLLANGRHLSLIDPLQLEPDPEPVAPRAAKKATKPTKPTKKAPVKAEVVEDDSPKSSVDTEERRPFSFKNDRQSDPTISGEREERTSEHS